MIGGNDRMVSSFYGMEKCGDSHRVSARTAPGKTATDRQIDQLVYELYGLTDEEIKVVEA